MMSKGRLSDVRMALTKAGWEVENNQDMYSIEDEMITWKLINSSCNKHIALSFYVVGDMGEVSEDLNNIRRGTVFQYGITIVFDKRDSETWRHNVSEFIANLSRLCLSSDNSRPL